MANLILNKPKEMMEPADEEAGLTCWAAALASFLDVNPRAPASMKGMSQEALVLLLQSCDWMSRLIKHKQLVLGNGALTKDGLGVMLYTANMKVKAFPDIRKLNIGYFQKQLADNGHLYLVLINPGHSFSHAVVVYGVTEDANGYWSLSVMDPWPATGGLVQYDATDLAEFKQAMVGWFN